MGGGLSERGGGEVENPPAGRGREVLFVFIILGEVGKAVGWVSRWCFVCLLIDFFSVWF